ncbi:hypothetical protein ATANTOWER_014909 [Ataeniobius toweri]|uniref:Uncharacterized protein n=1 Tax=Ataeniobius toweri TaxID=208326 RepID=A0ABU7BSQ3_9TELE|nr:hypothetical protein [Ataeniobius toweri]
MYPITSPTAPDNYSTSVEAWDPISETTSSSENDPDHLQLVLNRVSGNEPQGQRVGSFAASQQINTALICAAAQTRSESQLILQLHQQHALTPSVNLIKGFE